MPDIKLKIVRSLVRNAETDAGRMQVAVQGQKVRLSGSVRAWQERQEAQRAAWSTAGVTMVENNIAIIPGI